LALIAHDPSREWSAICIGRPKRGTTPREDVLGHPSDSAVDLLADLVALYDAGRREPLPLPTKTSYAWAEARHSHGDPEREAGFRWKSNDRFPGEDAEPAHERAWGKGVWLKALVDKGLDDYACRLWLPMLRALGT
jgi:exodeoxyribonuclease V gamma subunit